MKTYVLTVFSSQGEKLLDEQFTAHNHQEAKKIGQTILEEKKYTEHTHRCVTSNAKLLLFRQ